MKNKKLLKWSLILLLLLLTAITPSLFSEDNKYNDMAFVKKCDITSTDKPFGNHKEYYSTFVKIPPDYIDEIIGNVKLNGYDEYYYEVISDIDAEVYSIKGINPRCTGALKLPNSNNFYIYSNSSYQPESLGEFINDLNLTENLSFGNIRCYYSVDRIIEYKGISNEDIWQYLFKDNLSLKNVYTGDTWYEPFMSIEATFDIPGFNSAVISISEDGYLFTNSFSSAQAFYIGEEKVNAFINFVKNELEATEMPIIHLEDDLN